MNARQAAILDAAEHYRNVAYEVRRKLVELDRTMANAPAWKRYAAKSVAWMEQQAAMGKLCDAACRPDDYDPIEVDR